MKGCDEVQDLLPELLPWVRGPALEVHEHLQRCAECRELADDLVHTLHRLESSPGAPTLDEGFADRVLHRLPDDPGWSVGPAPAGRVIPLRRLLLQGAAAAACFAAGAALTLGLRDRDPGAGSVAAQGAPRVIRVGPGGERLPAGTQLVVGGEDPRARGPRPGHDHDPGWQGEWAAHRAPDAWGPDGWSGARPLVRYVSQAGQVLEAVADLDAGQDPRALQVLRVTLQRSDLLDEGDELLAVLEPAGASQAELRRLISGTQLVLRKVRNARQDAPEVLWALRREVRETGLLDAYRQLLVSAAAREPEREAPPPAEAAPWKPTDPL